ncbi:uncharacterized protein (TIGR02453 family) [Mucilaginibacter yixingensis]|uniref:Uncharacterized protein (TIGR02453 family) n=1 Tax=Mucilaginibacter yixingensis TaxID=1295612 RepID=A0A2T5J758_9SPHI|nr:DUF2461 domain-containing protein [Mucilaginibacter yixingensis]PTQ94987.1 uncharacterized protein (TIGR02453 family) [Mucilaginibacter yixingensis]
MIKSETLKFFTALAENNHRDWFMAHKDEFEVVKENITDFAGEVIKSLSKIDPLVDPATDPKKCVMRIYRDIRFSKDKTPYKTWLGIHKFTAGKYTGGIGYYIHIQPGQSFAGGGYWLPEGDHLKAIRQEVDYNADELKAIVDAPDFKSMFGEFRDQEQLKGAPAGYQTDDENISLIKLKSFTAVKSITDKELQQKDLIDTIAAIFEKIYPLNTFLQQAVSTT